MGCSFLARFNLSLFRPVARLSSSGRSACLPGLTTVTCRRRLPVTLAAFRLEAIQPSSDGIYS